MISRSANDVRRRIRAIRIWQLALAVFAVTFAVYLPTAEAKSLDVLSADVAAWQVAATGTTTFDPDLFPELDESPLRDVWIGERSDGTLVISRTPGTIAPAVPAYWFTQPESRTDEPAEFTAALMTAIAVAVLFIVLTRHISRQQALAATAVVAFTTPVWSVSADGMWPHTITALAIAGMAWAADRDRWWSLGALGGLAMWGRPHAAIICAVVGVWIAWRRRDPIIALKAGAAGSVMLTLLAIWNHWFYGTWSPTGLRDPMTYSREESLAVVNQLGLWISPDRGILVWTPIILLLSASVARNWKNLPEWSRALLVGGLIYTIAQGQANKYSGGSAFWPYRLGIEMVLTAAPAFALSITSMGAVARRIWPHVAIVQGAAIFVGAVGLTLMPEVNTGRPELLVQGLTACGIVVVSALVYAMGRWLVRRDNLIGETISSPRTS